MSRAEAAVEGRWVASYFDQAGRRLTWLPVSLWSGPQQGAGFNLTSSRFSVCVRMQWFPPGSSVHLISDHPETVGTINLGPDGRRARDRGDDRGGLPSLSTPGIWRLLDRILEERSQTLSAGPPETELDHARFASAALRPGGTRYLLGVRITPGAP